MGLAYGLRMSNQALLAEKAGNKTAAVDFKSNPSSRNAVRLTV